MTRWLPLRVVDIEPPVTPHEREAYVAHVRRLMVRFMRFVGALCLLAAIAWWPLDAVVFPDDPAARQALGQMRIAGAGAGVLLLLAHNLRSVRRRAHALVLALFVLLNTYNGVEMAGVGGLDGPWMYFFFVTPGGTLFIPLRLPWRIVGTIALGAGPILAFAAVDPSNLDSPHLWPAVSFMGFGVLTSILCGVALEQLLESQFVHRRRWQRLEQDLEERVSEKTAEVRALLQHLERARDEEGSALARELHDGVGQELSALHFAVAVAKRSAESEGRSTRDLLDIQALLDRTRTSTRRMLALLKPEALERLAPADAVRWLAEDVERRCGVRSTLTFEPEDLEIQSDLAMPLFRCVQEALTNIARHAGANTASVVVVRDSHGLRLTVRDRGSGPPDGDGRGPGMGLLGIRERAAALGGGARWGPAQGGGFEVEVLFPTEGPA